MRKMKAAIFFEPGRIALDGKPIPDIGPSETPLRVTSTTICGVDLGALCVQSFRLDPIEAANELFAHQRDGVLKVAITT